MQRSLQKQVDDLKEETLRLSQHGNMLRAAYNKTIETDEMKTSFLHYITGQMTAHTESVDKCATKLCNGYQDLSRTETDQQVDDIQRRSQTIVELLNLVAHYAESDRGKEASHE
jgi:methyl-accepting chemotaxis protein